MVLRQVKLVTAVCLSAALSACGGGGGQDGGNPTTPPKSEDANANSANSRDGLGAEGHANGTVVLGAAALPGAEYNGTPLIAIAMSDEGRALAVWQVKAKIAADTTAAWAQSSIAGSWSSATPLPLLKDADYHADLTLRMNQAGNAVLGWVHGGSVTPSGFRATRFFQDRGWETTAYDASGASASDVDTRDQSWSSGTTHSWDLTLLDDNSFASSVSTTTGSANLYSGVQLTDVAGKQTITFQSTEIGKSSLPEASFTPKQSNGYGLLYQTVDTDTPPGGRALRARLASLNKAAFGDFPVAAYSRLCRTESYDGPLISVVTPKAEGVLAVLNAANRENCNYHNLQLNRIYTATSIRVESQTLNTVGSVLPVAPALAVDNDGNALVVWKEALDNRYPPDKTIRLFWSQSLYGGPWSTPQAISANLSTMGNVRREGHIALAMNGKGQAIISIKVDGLTNSSVNQSVVASKFSFESGWTPWQKIANKQNLTDPKVAINANGLAVIAYTGLPALRVNGEAPTAISTKDALANAYAYRF